VEIQIAPLGSAGRAVYIVGTAVNSTRRNRVGESTRERQIADGLERIEGDDTYKSLTGEYD
jgi:hypothetical protein